MKQTFKLWVIKLHNKRTGRVTVETGYERGIPLLFRTRKDADDFVKNFSLPADDGKPVRAMVTVEDVNHFPDRSTQ